MKVTAFVMLFLAMNAEASFFDDFTGAMSSVENAFGKLLNDVVTDVKTTVHCTILAMEQVLAMNGIMAAPLRNKECYNDDDNFNIDTKRDSRNFNSAKDIAQHISSSISKVNKTLGHVLDNNGHERLEDVKRALKNGTDRLTEVSLLLRQELEKISQRLKKEFQNVDLDSDKSSLESIWNNIKILYEVEKNDKNASAEIGEVLNEALNVLHLNTNGEVKSDEDKIKVIMQELEQESNVSSVLNNTINHELAQWKEKQSVIQRNLEHKLIHEPIPKNLKDVAIKSCTDNDKIRKTVNDIIGDKSSSIVNIKPLSENTQTENDATKNPKADSNNDSPLGATSSEDKKALDEAIDILKNTAQSQALLDDFLSKEHGVNVFDNSNLLNLKK